MRASILVLVRPGRNTVPFGKRESGWKRWGESMHRHLPSARRARRRSARPWSPEADCNDGNERHIRRSNEYETKSSRMGRVDRGVGRAGELIGLPAPDARCAEGPPGGPAGGQSLSEAYEAVAEFVRPSVVQITVQKKAAGMPHIPGMPNMRRSSSRPAAMATNQMPRDFEEHAEEVPQPRGGLPEQEQFGTGTWGSARASSMTITATS